MANLELIILIVEMRPFCILKSHKAMGVLKKMNVSTFDEGQKQSLRSLMRWRGEWGLCSFQSLWRVIPSSDFTWSKSWWRYCHQA